MLKQLFVVVIRFVKNVAAIVRSGKRPNLKSCWYSAKHGVSFDSTLVRNQEEAALTLRRTIDKVFALYGTISHAHTGTVPYCRAALMGLVVPTTEEEHRTVRVSAEWQNYKVASCIAANLVVEGTITYEQFHTTQYQLEVLDKHVARQLVSLGQDITPRRCSLIEAAEAIGQGMPVEQAKWIVIKAIWPDVVPAIQV
jgi:hypothetical protein